MLFFCGTYIEWCCAAECPEPEECEEYISWQHFDYSKVSETEVQERIKKEGPRT